MNENMPGVLYLPLPEDLRKQYEEFDRQGLLRMSAEQWQSAAEIFMESYLLLKEKQPPETRYHKGGPLHFLGICYWMLGRKPAALQHFLLAYIEDLLSKQEGEINRAENEAAARTLRALSVPEAVLGAVRRVTQTHAASVSVVREPADVLTIAERSAEQLADLQSLAGTLPDAFQKLRQEPLPTPWINRVFVGGNYENAALLLSIKNAVLRAHCEPILVAEFAIPQDHIRHHSLMLLHTCRRAIFEVTGEGGQLMEIERCRDYEIEVLLLYSRFPGDSSPPRVSAMVKTAGYPLTPYQGVDVLQDIVIRFLTDRPSAEKGGG